MLFITDQVYLDYLFIFFIFILFILFTMCDSYAQSFLCRGEPGFGNVVGELRVPGGFHKYVLAAKKWKQKES